MRDRNRPVNHYLRLPPACFPALDEMATLEGPSSSLRPVAEEWQALQPEVVQHVTRVLRTHSYKVSCALAETGQQRVRGRKRSAPHAAEAELSSSDNENGDPTAHIRSVGEKSSEHRDGVASSKLESSDWEDDYKADNARPVNERWGADGAISQTRHRSTQPHGRRAVRGDCQGATKSRSSTAGAKSAAASTGCADATSAAPSSSLSAVLGTRISRTRD